MKFVSALPVLAALAFTTPALAQQQTPPPDRMAAMATHHADMCANFYAHAVGKVAELEARLNLTAAQKAPFAHWKDIKLAHAKAASEKCTDFTPPGPDASIMDRRQRQIARLQQRLDNMKAETPALEALVKVLTPEQQNVLKRVAREVAGERMMRMRRFEQFRGHPGEHHPMDMGDHQPTP